MSAMRHVEVHVECLVLDLGADGRPDEGAVRRATADALAASDGLSGLSGLSGPGGRAVSDVVARQVAREVRELVAPC